MLRISAMRLASLTSAAQVLRSHEAALIENLGLDGALAPSIAEAMAKALKIAAQRRFEIEAQLFVQAAAAREREQKAKLAERLAADARLKLEHELAERHLQEIIDFAIGPKSVSPP
jgi:hypothetical protein